MAFGMWHEDCEVFMVFLMDQMQDILVCTIGLKGWYMIKANKNSNGIEAFASSQLLKHGRHHHLAKTIFAWYKITICIPTNLSFLE